MDPADDATEWAKGLGDLSLARAFLGFRQRGTDQAKLALAKVSDAVSVCSYADGQDGLAPSLAKLGEAQNG